MESEAPSRSKSQRASLGLKGASSSAESDQGGSVTRSTVLDGLSSVTLRQQVESAGDDEGAVLREVAEALGFPWVPGALPIPEGEMVEQMSSVIGSKVALDYEVVPCGLDNEGALIATWNPLDLIGMQAVLRECPVGVRWVMASRANIREAIQGLYGVGVQPLEEILADKERIGGQEADLGDFASEIDGDDDEAAVIRFVNHIIRDALERRATDIHIEPFQDDLQIRYRIDGVLNEASVPKNIKALHPMVMARIKVMAKLDIAERRLPQDGRIHLNSGGASIDVRVATIPSVEGESASLRLLGREAFSMDKLGLSDELKESFNSLLKDPNGIVLVTGPTGCGKSTSLYTFLSELNSKERRVITIEDPVEHKLPGIVQIPVRPEIDLTFSSGLRSILRGDPNVIMVGEIRDVETAEIASRAALTGHLVFSTLHTNDALGGILRLVDMGLEPFLVASAVRAFIAQRLVRKLCKECRVCDTSGTLGAEAVGVSGLLNGRVFGASPEGCEACRGTGYHGRLAIYELVNVTPKLGELICARATRKELLDQAIADGYQTMRSYGLAKVLEGETTIEEVLSVTTSEEG